MMKIAKEIEIQVSINQIFVSLIHLRMETINDDGYNISMDSYCKAPLRISCSIGCYINSRLLLLLLLLPSTL